MSGEKFTFEGLDEIEARLGRLKSDAAYLVIQDRTIPRQDETLARFELTEADAFPYLDEPTTAAAPTGERAFFGDDPPEDDDPYREDADGDDDGDDDEGSDPDADADDRAEPERPRSGQLSEALIVRAACRWIRDVATRNTIGEEWRRFRVKVYSPKGVKLLDSGQFVCRNHDFDLQLPSAGLPPAPVPMPTLDEAANQGGAKALKALGEYYARFGQIVLGTVGQLQGVNNATISRLHRDLERSRDQVEELVAAILTNRFNEIQAAENRRVEETAGDTRAALARDALNQLGEATKAFFAAQGLSPELADVAKVLGQSPDLLGALKDPDVQTLMSDPGNLKLIAGMLKQAGLQAKAMQTPPGGAGPAPPGHQPPSHQASPPPAG